MKYVFIILILCLCFFGVFNCDKKTTPSSKNLVSVTDSGREILENFFLAKMFNNQKKILELNEKELAKICDIYQSLEKDSSQLAKFFSNLETKIQKQYLKQHQDLIENVSK